MKLTDEMFESIIGCALPQLEKARGNERRQNGRVRVPARIHVIPMPRRLAGKPILAQVRDISPTGVGLLLPQKLDPGDSLLARLTSKRITVWLMCEVRRVERVAAGLYVTGATYERVVSTERQKAPSAAMPQLQKSA